ncbi:MAG: hypothetical protein ACRD33_04095 [Candidatus Acidiferrales bacterium]
MEDRPKKKEEQNSSDEKATVTLAGVVEKIIPPIDPREPEKAQIVIEGADHLYREIRVENSFKDPDGNDVSVGRGAEVDVTIEAEPEATRPKKP